MRDVYTTLSGFSSEQVSPLGEISLLITNDNRRVRDDTFYNALCSLVLVRDGAWRMCVNFTDINKACPKDCYSLPEIDWKVDSLFDFKVKCFLDAYKGYHQIQISKEDEHKTDFHAPQGIGRNLEAYVDDIVIKSMDETDMIADIQETFERLQKINKKLNLKKCSFGMEEGQFLGHVVSKQALNRFLSKSIEKSLPFFKILKGCFEKKDFTWTREAGKAIEEMKRYIEKLPTLIAPKAGENLIVYLAASKECISVVLMAEKGKYQRPIYFVSKVLQGAELNYPIMEKLVLALIHVARRLKRHFQAHNITVLTNKPIRLLLLKLEKSGRVAGWAIELGEHEIEFKPRNAVKAHILVDFLAETKIKDEEIDFQEQQLEGQNRKWKLYTDGASSGNGSGAGLMIVNPEGTKFTYALKFKFTATNNEVEYEVVIARLRIAKRDEDRGNYILCRFIARSQPMAETTVKDGTSWMTPIMEYFVSGILPANKKLARKTRVKALNYRIINGILYKRSFLTPWLRCVGPKQAKNRLSGSHPKLRSMSNPLTNLRLPKQDMTLVTAAWPFIQWGIDIVGPLPEAPGKVKFLIVAVDYFTKWVEGKPLASVTGKCVERFVWEHTVCCFGIPQMIVSDNKKQFEEGVFP
ncbi:reverse transcriptase domain-containing protein [Tanacetum coccineum]